MPANGEQPGKRGSLGWLLLLVTPPVVVVAGLATIVYWQGSKGGIQPKWRKPAAPAAVTAPATNPPPISSPASQ